MVHPNHPLNGQLVRVVRQTGHPAYTERQWVVELPDQTRGSLPLSWAVSVEGLPEEPSEIDDVEEANPCVTVSTLLRLARMVRNLTTIQSDKGETHGQSTTLAPIIGAQPSAGHSLRSPATLGATAPPATTGFDHAAGDAAGQMSTEPDGSGWTGGQG